MVTSNSPPKNFNEDTFVIYDPSGPILTVHAQFLGFGPIVRGDSEGYPCLVALERAEWNDKVFNYGDPIIPDPRSVIVGSNGNVIYTPRPNFSNLSSSAQQWLNDNSDWPDSLMKELSQ